MTSQATTFNPIAVLKLLRPLQWIKNGFVLGPLVFSGLFSDPGSVLQALLAMAVFCATSSTIYILNDLRDIEEDRAHQTKSKTRPLASGKITPPIAYGVFIVMMALVGLGLIVMPPLALPIAGYVFINLGYSYYLKKKPVIDLFCIAAGFVLRVYAGALALDIVASPWIVVTTLCLALYLAAIKRRQELAQQGSGSREVLGIYTIGLLDRYAEMAAVSALLFYGLYVFTVHPELVLSIPLVLFGLFRYWYIVEVHGGGESPTDALVRDWPLLATLVVWAGLCMWVLSQTL
jgi:decaprenyl-phosphate phosphoribosyltransferase